MRANQNYETTLYTETWLRKKYLEEGMTATQIGLIVGSPTSTVLRALRRLGISIRHEVKPPEKRVCPNVNDPRCKKEFLVGGRGSRARSAVYCSRHCHMMHQAPRSTASGAPRPRKNVDTLHKEPWLREHYIAKRMSMGEIAIRCNCSSQSVKWALEKFQIPIRSLSEANFGKKVSRGDQAGSEDNSARGRSRKRSAIAYRKLKQEMVDAYGGCCTCCGEKELAFLSLDHARGGGMEERTRIGGSVALYRHLQKLGWPQSGYRCLCMNCQIGTKYGRTCPHQLKKEAT